MHTPKRCQGNRAGQGSLANASYEGRGGFLPPLNEGALRHTMKGPWASPLPIFSHIFWGIDDSL
eukprot:1789198-Pyramimonas_sp.AAC.1